MAKQRNNVRAFGRAMKQIQTEVLEEVAQAIIGEAQRILLSEGRHATQELIEGFDYSINKSSGQVRVFNKRRYATYVEFGRRPGGKFPPPDAIEDWLAAKGLPTDNQTIYLIGRSIAENGIAPVRFFTRALSVAPAEVESRMRDKVSAWLSLNRPKQSRRIPIVF